LEKYRVLSYVNSIGAGGLSTLFLKYGLVSREERSLTVAALIGAARVSKRFLDT